MKLIIKEVICINIKEVNEQYIFYKDGGCIKSRHDNLTRVLEIAKENIDFYNRMFLEINVYIEKQETVVNNSRPGEEPPARSYSKHLDWEQKRKEYLEECAVFKAYADLQHDALVKLDHWRSILKQTERALILVKR